MSSEKKYLSWERVFQRLQDIFQPGNVYYGVPKGGMIAAGFLSEFTSAEITHDPKKATVILDDIVDSGKTREFYKKLNPEARFIPLFNRENHDGKWLVFPWEADHPAGEETVEDNITRVLEYIGENPSREGLSDTPKRVVKSWKELYAGYSKKPEDTMTVFESDGYDEMVILRDIEIYSMCEHHMLPFYGKAHIGYIPDGKVIGISKLARIADIYARRLQIQERIGMQITQAIMNMLKPKGVGCVIEARHMCMCARGVGKQNSLMVTSSMKGALFDDSKARHEFMDLIKPK